MPHIAIFGLNGVGKTTLAKLLADPIGMLSNDIRQTVSSEEIRNTCYTFRSPILDYVVHDNFTPDGENLAQISLADQREGLVLENHIKFHSVIVYVMTSHISERDIENFRFLRKFYQKDVYVVINKINSFTGSFELLKDTINNTLVPAMQGSTRTDIREYDIHHLIFPITYLLDRHIEDRQPIFRLLMAIFSEFVEKEKYLFKLSEWMSQDYQTKLNRYATSIEMQQNAFHSISREKENTINQLNVRIATIEENNTNALKQFEERVAELEHSKKQLEEKLQRVEKENQVLNQNKKLLDDSQQREETLRNNEERFKKIQEEWQKECSETKQKLDSISSKNTESLGMVNNQLLALLERQNEIEREKEDIRKQKKELKKLQPKATGQQISVEQLLNIQQEEKRLQEWELSLTERETDLLKDIVIINQKKKELEEKYNSISKQLALLKSDDEVLQSLVVQAKQSEQFATETEFKRNTLIRWKKDRDMLNAKIDQMEKIIDKADEVIEKQQDRIQTTLQTNPVAVKLSLDNYRRQLNFLERIIQDSIESLQFVDNKEWSEALKSLLPKLSESTSRMAKQLDMNKQTNLLRLIEMEWKKGPILIAKEIAGILEFDSVAECIIEDLKQCYAMMAPPVIIEAREKLLKEHYQSLLRALGRLAKQEQELQDSPKLKSFPSYSWANYRHAKRVHQFVYDMRTAGIPMFLDIDDNKDGSITRFTENVNQGKSEFVFVMGTFCMKNKWDHPRNKVLPEELEQIGCRARDEAGFPKEEQGIIKILLEGENDQCYPDYLRPGAARIFNDTRYYAYPISEFLALLVDRVYVRYNKGCIEKANQLKEIFLKHHDEIIKAETIERLEELDKVWDKHTGTYIISDNNNVSPFPKPVPSLPLGQSLMYLPSDNGIALTDDLTKPSQNLQVELKK